MMIRAEAHEAAPAGNGQAGGTAADRLRRRTDLCGRVHADRPAGNAIEPVLLVECPRILFPFARNILADVTRDGGFPPVLLQPIDFVALWQAAAPRPSSRRRQLPDRAAAARAERPAAAIGARPTATIVAHLTAAIVARPTAAIVARPTAAVAVAARRYRSLPDLAESIFGLTEIDDCHAPCVIARSVATKQSPA